MATLIGDFAADHSRLHHTMVQSNLPYQQQHEPRYRSSSRSRDVPSRPHSSSNPLPPAPSQASPTAHPTRDAQRNDWEDQEDPVAEYHDPPGSGDSCFPTPPDSASPSESSSTQARPQHGHSPAYMASSGPTGPASDPSSTSTPNTAVSAPGSARQQTHSIPSPVSDGGHGWPQPRHDGSAVAGPAEAPRAPKVIHITDLAHIQKLAHLDMVTGNGPGILNDPPLGDMKFEISSMPIGDIIEMVAALLTKITTTNDLQHDALNRNITHQRQQAQNEGSDSHSSPFSTSVLAFHGKNVPAITILSYLSRIHKYCPTTYEVFLSLVVYFDRMAERVNDLVIRDEEAKRKEQQDRTAAPPADSDTVMVDHQDSDEYDEDLADSDDEDATSRGKHPSEAGKAAPADDIATSAATFFVVDSFNIHRLIIAGVTCASKFFSDVFYTNSRYAKVSTHYSATGPRLCEEACVPWYCRDTPKANQTLRARSEVCPLPS